MSIFLDEILLSAILESSRRRSTLNSADETRVFRHFHAVQQTTHNPTAKMNVRIAPLNLRPARDVFYERISSESNAQCRSKGEGATSSSAVSTPRTLQLNGFTRCTGHRARAVLELNLLVFQFVATRHHREAHQKQPQNSV